MFAKAPLRQAADAWESQIIAAAKAAGRDGAHLHARIAQQQLRREMRTGLVKSREVGPFARALSAEMRRCHVELFAVPRARVRIADLGPPLNAPLPLNPLPAPKVQPEPWERKPEVRPYDWWRRLPLCEDEALNAALRRAIDRAHPHWRDAEKGKEFRLALLGGGSFRDCYHVLTRDGYDTDLIVKKPVRDKRLRVRHGEVALQNDLGNGQEATVYLHLAQTEPEALSCFPVLYETEPEFGDWAIHEKVQAECRGKETTQELEGRWRSAGVESGDLHGGNIGRRNSDRCTLVIDYGHFTVRDLHGGHLGGPF